MEISVDRLADEELKSRTSSSASSRYNKANAYSPQNSFDSRLQSPASKRINLQNQVYTTSSSDLRRYSIDETQCLESAVVDYKPVGTWIEKNILVGCPESKIIHMSSSFIPIGLSINCHSTTTTVLISARGISKIKILFRGEEQLQKQDQKQGQKQELKQKQGPSHMSISEMAIPDSSTDEKGIQRITLELPSPCKTVEVLIVQRSADFVCVFGVHCFSSSVRPSSQSTPIPLNKRKQLTSINIFD